jgi:hypothetical protein
MQKKELKDRYVHRVFSFDPPLSERLDKAVPTKARSKFVRESVNKKLDEEKK